MKHQQRNITIHHFDDEPDNIASLRENMLFLTMRLLPEVIHMEDIPVEDDFEKPYNIVIHLANGGALTVAYIIYDEAQKFHDTASLVKGDIVLLDAIERGPQGEAIRGVEKCLAKAMAVIDKSHLFLVSAFVNELPQDLKGQFNSDCVIKKPFDVNDLALRLLKLSGLAV